jgi:flagellar basal body P-ring protein FlgI
VVVKTYSNANFVNLTIERKFYERFAKLADRFGVTMEKMINTSMIILLKEIEELAEYEHGSESNRESCDRLEAPATPS